jgi:hypothetical protein
MRPDGFVQGTCVIVDDTLFSVYLVRGTAYSPAAD